jgi:hypothetical protein
MRPDKIVFFAAGMRQNNANNSQRPTILAKKVRGIVSAIWQKCEGDLINSLLSHLKPF